MIPPPVTAALIAPALTPAVFTPTAFTPAEPATGRALLAVAGMDVLIDPLDAVGRWLTELAAAAIGAAPVLAPVTAVVAAAAWLAREHLARRERRRDAKTARLVTILPPPEADLAAARALWAHLMGIARPPWRRLLSGQPHLAWEYTWSPSGMHISCWVPGSIPPALIEAAITAAWPGATTTTQPVTGTPKLIPTGAGFAAGTLGLADIEHYALGQDFETDPLRPLIAAAADRRDNETACVQICARPAVGRWRLSGSRRAAKTLRHGTGTNPAAAATELFLPGGAGSKPGTAGRLPADPQVTPDVRDILDKAAQPRWDVVIRYAVTTTDRPATTTHANHPTGRPDATRPADGESPGDDEPDAAAGRNDEPHLGRDLLPAAVIQARLRGRAHALATASAIFTARNRLARHRLRHGARVISARDMGRGWLLSVGELAALAHLPLDIAVPGLERAGARILPIPAVIPSGGHGCKIIGDGVSPQRPVGLPVIDARRHVHVLGPTGSGKSTLLLNLILADIAAHRGVVVIDPGGDLVTDVLARLPAEVGDRLVIIDPDSRYPAPALNPLHGGDPEVAVDQIAGICRETFSPFWGPRTDDVFRATALTLLHAHPDTATLADVPRLLTDTRARAAAVGQIDDGMLRDFWKWYADLGDQQQALIIAPLLNKMRAFLMRTPVRRTIAAPRATFSMADVLNRGGVCLARLPEGTLGTETAHLLGSLLVAQVWQAVTARAAIPAAARRDASLYLDEFQHFLNLPSSAEQILTEARRFKLSLTLAHQNLTQLAEQRSLKDAVAANARHKLWFATSPRDAHELEEHVTPYATEHDLAHLGAHQILARLVVDGDSTPPCTVRTRPAPPEIPGRAEEVRARSARRFGRDRRERRRAGTRTDPATADRTQ